MASFELKTKIITRNDSSAKWLENSDQVLLKGEMAIEFTESGEPKIKIGDGVTPWAELKYFGGETAVKFFEAEPQTVEGVTESHAEAIARVVGDAEVADGSFAVVKAAIAGGKYEYTAYVCAGGEWEALDGNYNAENVYFKEDLVTTAAVGNITLTNGQATIPAAGKNLKEVFNAIFLKEKNPTSNTKPSVTISGSVFKAYEVGTKVTPSWDATFKAGSYQYGPATGITVTAWSATDGTNTATTEDGSFPEITVSDDTSYSVTATASYTDGAIPVTNTGNQYAAAQFKAGTASATTGKITGYRNTFYGTVTTKGEVTSDVIRALAGKSDAALANGAKFDVTVPVGAMRVIIAYPATLQDITAIQDNNDSMSNIVPSFTKTTVAVEGAGGHTAVDYKVYTIDFANANDAANKYSVTI